MTQEQGLCIYLLGPLRIERDNTPIHLPRRKVESLLAYLILRPEAHTRDQLATLFWGDSTDAQARHSLRTALATVRQELSPDLLYTDREQIQLNSSFPLWVDLHQLLALEDQLDYPNQEVLRAGLALWQGELLDGMYDDWISLEREHVRTRLTKLFLQLTQSLRALSEYALAIEVAQQVLALDPANELAHQHLMFCYVAAGNRPAALRQYEFCERALEEELDAEPMPETTALYEWIKQYDSEESSAGKITNLPIPLTSFVGRTREAAEVKRLLHLAYSNGKEKVRKSAVRLLTLTGAGGNGKTRLAIHVATDLIDSFAQGVWWVELAALSDGALVGRAVAKALGVSEVKGQTATESVAKFTGNKEMLLVFDNCEHLIEPCAQVAAELLGRCPNLQILATSRESLNVAGETVWQVPTFAAPEPAKVTLVDLLLQYESLRLFVERAATVQAGFALTPENAQAVAEICRQLDGIPLAIELAAARVKVLSVEQIAAYLTAAIGARFALLTQGNRALPARQQTLRATIDWSYELLDEAERLLFRQVAIFRDGFTLETLEQVVDLATSGPLSGPLSVPFPAFSGTLDRLTQLVDKSLVIVEPTGGQNRYHLLETLREYALERFSSNIAAGVEELQQLQLRHAEVFLLWAEQASEKVMSGQQQEWLNRLDIEHANLRAALEALIAAADGERALRLASALQSFWDYRGYVSEARAWFQRALALRAAASPATLARALDGCGWLTYRQGDLEQAQQLYSEALALSEQVGDKVVMAEAIQHLGLIDMDHGDYSRAEARLEESLRICRRINYEHGVARALGHLGALAWDQDRFVEARDYRLESLQIYQSLGNRLFVAYESLAVGDTERMLGNNEAACRNFEECHQIARTLGYKGLTGAALKSLGLLSFGEQNFEQARRYLEEALEIFREVGDKTHTAFSLSALGDVARMAGELEQALSYYGQTLQIMYEVGFKWPIFTSLEDIAGLLSQMGRHPDTAVRMMGAADKLRQETGLAMAPNQQERNERTVSLLAGQAGEVRFDALWQEGQEMPLAQIVTEALQIAA